MAILPYAIVYYYKREKRLELATTTADEVSC
jgi:hypothetical protein